jgi:putative endonuclease
MAFVKTFREAHLALLQRALRTTARAAKTIARAPEVPPHLRTGSRGEDEAFFWLRRNGFVVVARQWKSPMYPGDIDLIAWDGDCLCVVEVKTRTRRDEFFTAEGAVNEEKRRALRRLANAYVRRLPTAPARKRMDVLSVYLEPGKPARFQHFPAAIAWNE